MPQSMQGEVILGKGGGWKDKGREKEKKEEDEEVKEERRLKQGRSLVLHRQHRSWKFQGSGKLFG